MAVRIGGGLSAASWRSLRTCMQRSAMARSSPVVAAAASRFDTLMAFSTARK